MNDEVVQSHWLMTSNINGKGENILIIIYHTTTHYNNTTHYIGYDIRFLQNDEHIINNIASPRHLQAEIN